MFMVSNISSLSKSSLEHHEVLWKYFLKTIECKIFQV